MYGHGIKIHGLVTGHGRLDLILILKVFSNVNDSIL